MAAIFPLISLVSIEARPLAYAARIICSAVKHPSAYAHPSSPTEWPTIPSGLMPIAYSMSTSPIWFNRIMCHILYYMSIKYISIYYTYTHMSLILYYTLIVDEFNSIL